MFFNRPSTRRDAHTALWSAGERSAFTLIELLVVVTIVGILMSLLGAVVSNTTRKAREAATTTLIQKIDGLLEERVRGFDRATKSRDFQRTVEATTAYLLNLSEDVNMSGALDPGEDLNNNGVIDRGVLRLSPAVIEAVARKRFYRDFFPQRFEEMTDTFTPPSTTGTPNGIPDVLERDPQITFDATKHRRRTESSALLYYALTRMAIFGVPPVGESEFGTSEVRDTDGDGLLEFVDGWGRPLRFYRWPTRLLKPNGPYGRDGLPGSPGTMDFANYGRVGSDDVVVPTRIREIAGLLIDGLVSGPVVAGQWDVLSEDPDDPYGVIMTELKRQRAAGIHAYTTFPASAAGTPGPATSPGRYQEPFYPTLDTYHTPLVVSVGPDGSRPTNADTGADTEVERGLGLFEPWQGEDTNGDGIPDLNLGILAQPRYGPDPFGTIPPGTSPYDIDVTSLVINALTDNITNRNRRAGRGK